MMKFLRLCWAPFGLMFRMIAWIMVPGLGLVLSWRHGRNRRHRQLVEASRPLPPPPPPPPNRTVP
jgi:hypothetical protein